MKFVTFKYMGLTFTVLPKENTLCLMQFFVSLLTLSFPILIFQMVGMNWSACLLKFKNLRREADRKSSLVTLTIPGKKASRIKKATAAPKYHLPVRADTEKSSANCCTCECRIQMFEILELPHSHLDLVHTQQVSRHLQHKIVFG